MKEVSFGQILALFPHAEVKNPDPSLQVRDVTSDSNKVTPGSVFVAVRGERFDGHEFIGAALQKGAVAVIASERAGLPGVPAIILDDTRESLARIAALIYEEPSKQLVLIGITGTNGKTTTNWMIYNLLIELRGNAARLGTLGMEYFSSLRSVSLEGSLTTPDAVSIQRDLSQFVSNGVSSAVMEVSSHALHQKRVDGLHFDVAIYTNLTRDHLDYHKDMKEYFNAKAHIFSLLAESEKEKKTAVVNIDCQYGPKMVELAAGLGLPCLTVGKSLGADISIEECEQSLAGSRLRLRIHGKSLEFNSPFIGYHNAENLCAAIGAVLSIGYELTEVIAKVPAIPQVPGRLESVGHDRLGIFVDYAHTPDALQNVLESLRPLVRGKLWVVFGCGGDRDKGKRPEMGRIAARFADRLVVTSDNPRTEDPRAIISDILSSGITVFLSEPDRRIAIEKAIEAAEEGDIILIAGKGHENYQILGESKVHFSDVEEVQRVLRKSVL